MMSTTRQFLMVVRLPGLPGGLGESDQDVDSPYARPVPKTITCREAVLFRC